MNRFYPANRVFLTLLFTTLLCTCASAQTTLAFQSFEGAATDTWGYTLDPATYSEGAVYWEVRPTVENIDPFDGGFLFGGRDIENNNGGRSGDNFIIFDEIQLNGANNVLLSFYYNVFEFDGGDDLAYLLTVDGVTAPEVLLLDGASNLSSNGWERVEIMIPDGSTSVQLTIAVDQNGGGDWFGIDLFELAAVPCGITTFGPEEVICITETPASGSDNFRINIPYSGVDDDVIITVEAGATTPANDVTATTVNIGDDPRTFPDGVIVLENSAGEFEEGDEIRITLSDPSGDCFYVLLISTTENQCRNPCDPNINPDNITFACDAQTPVMDMGTASVPFTNGPEPDVMVMVDDPAVTVGGDDPATEETGDILLSGLIEGSTYTLTLMGGGCVDAKVKTFTFTFEDGSCESSPLTINEFLADPDGDANRDGTVSTSGDEFVELYNASDAPINIGGFTVEEPGSGIFYTFPAGYMLPARTGFVVFAAATDQADFGCPVAQADRTFALNNNGDVITVRNATGGAVTEVTYGNEGRNNQSLARSPDFTGPFAQHMSITSNPVAFSPCEYNTIPGATLPIELRAFTAQSAPKAIELAWSTTNEYDNDYFLVDRSADGQNWQELGTVNAGPATSNDYAFTDQAPLPGTNLYRLRQTDLDGTQTNYGPVSADFFGANELTLFPNPATTVIHLNRTVEAGDVVTVSSITGKVLQRLAPGANSVALHELPNGIYLLSFERGSEREAKRFVKR